MSLFESIRELLPEPLRSRVHHAQLELTPHRAERVLLRDADEQPFAVAHLDDARQADRIEELHARLPQWRSHLPVVLARGQLGARPVWIRAYEAGLSLHDRLGDRLLVELAREGVSLLDELQSQSAFEARFDDAQRRIWLDEPLRSLEGTIALDPDLLADARRALEIVDGLASAPLPYATHHGDYQLTNLIARADGGHVVIDWELSHGEAPVAMDRIHFLIGLGVSGLGLSYGQSVRTAIRREGALGRLVAEIHASSDRADPLSPREGAALWAMTILHGSAHMARRVPHLFDRAVQRDMLESIGFVVEQAIGR